MTETIPSTNKWEAWEELANAWTHGFGFFLSLLGLAWIVTVAVVTEDVWKISSAIVFGTSLILLYASSTLYHSVRKPETKRLLRTLDHCAIYVLIAGSYTPFVLVSLNGPWGWSLFAVVWTMAVLGIIFKVFFTGRFRLLSTGFYLAMGWLVVVAASPLSAALPWDGCYLVLMGGLSYTLGAIIYAMHWPRFHHALWHLFVMGGSFCHYLAVLYYVI